MRIFSSLYAHAMKWSRHPHAIRYLAGLSFAESSFFPVPPDVMLAPMSMAEPKRAWYFAALTTVASVIGGVLGYFIGVFAFDLIDPWLHNWHYWEAYLEAKGWFGRWGVWAIFIAGFSPIPYKIFTITAGAVAMPLLPFLVASAVGRGTRFFLVAALMAWGGERMERALHRYVDRIGWILVGVFVLMILFLK
ncbi:MAG: DedA family protein [Candidatus Thiodiazotropha sp.]|jgi:membrane protein YqaA with SNARE-associated domain